MKRWGKDWGALAWVAERAGGKVEMELFINYVLERC